VCKEILILMPLQSLWLRLRFWYFGLNSVSSLLSVGGCICYSRFVPLGVLFVPRLVQYENKKMGTKYTDVFFLDASNSFEKAIGRCDQALTHVRPRTEERHNTASPDTPARTRTLPDTPVAGPRQTARLDRPASPTHCVRHWLSVLQSPR
jgi:hypothetical protein